MGAGGDNFLSSGAGADAVGGVSIRGADDKRWNYGVEGFVVALLHLRHGRRQQLLHRQRGC